MSTATRTKRGYKAMASLLTAWDGRDGWKLRRPKGAVFLERGRHRIAPDALSDVTAPWTLIDWQAPADRLSTWQLDSLAEAVATADAETAVAEDAR